MTTEFEDLNQQYHEALPAKCATIARACDEALELVRRKTTPDYRAIEALVHKLAGSSGTYGYHRLSGVCRHLEVAIGENGLAKLSHADQRSYLEAWRARFEACQQKLEKTSKSDDDSETANLNRIFETLGSRKAA